MISDFVQSAIRHSLTTLAGALVADGVLQASQTANFVGSVMFLIGVAWAMYDKYTRTRQPKGPSA